MSKTWRVIWYEYKRQVFRKRYFVALLSVPLMIVAIFGITILTTARTINYDPIGYVDKAGVLANPVYPEPEEDTIFSRPVKIIAYPSEETARAALDSSQIQAFYVLQPSYATDARVSLIYNDEPDGSVERQFTDFLRANLLRNVPADVNTRLTEGDQLTIQTPDGRRQVGEDEWYNIFVPLVIGMLFMMVVMMSGGYLLQAVVEEKENRTMEIIVTSLSPSQLMTGKIIGNLSVGLTQILIWVLFALAAVLIGRNYFPVLGNLSFGADYILLLMAVLLPAFVMIAALLAALGATVTESREAQQISGIFTIPIMLPYYFFGTLMSNPNSPLSVGFSLFPFTAPVAIAIRGAFSTIPAWQLAVSIGLLVLCAIGAIWLAARTFRLGMLRYGKRLSLREIFGKAG